MNHLNASVIEKGFRKNLFYMPKPVQDFMYKAVILILFAR